jgi:hypothetical protein
MERRKVILMRQSFAAIEAAHSGQWILVRVLDSKRDMGEFVCETREFTDRQLWEAAGREMANGYDVAVRFGGNPIPEGLIVAL